MTHTVMAVRSRLSCGATTIPSYVATEVSKWTNASIDKGITCYYMYVMQFFLYTKISTYIQCATFVG